MRKTKHRNTSTLIGVLLFASCLIIGVRIAPYADSEKMAGKLENPVVSTVDSLESMFITATMQVSAPSEYTTNDYLYALTTDKAMYIPDEYMPARAARYIDIEMSSYELWELAAIVQLEAGNQSQEGQQAVAEVVFNRVLHSGFPNTVHGVIHDDGGIGVVQFTTAANIDKAEPTQAQFDAIFAALHGDTILPAEVVFFSRDGENDRVWGRIGDHVFCYEYDWGN